MRRNRVRSYTIDAENEEEFNNKCEKVLKNNLSNVNSLNVKKLDELNKDIYQVDNDNKIQKNHDYLKNDDFGEIYENLSDEDFTDENDSEDIIDKYNQKNIDPEERNIELLCLYLKQSIALQAKEKNSLLEHDNIFYRYKNPIHVLSGNAIYDLDVKELVDDIMTENELDEKNEELKKGDIGKHSNLKEFISQNIKEDCTLKIMAMSNNDSTRNLYINIFCGINNETNNNDNKNDIDFEIRKKQIRLFNKNISLQIFDTSNEFHNNISSKIYYQFSNGFFIFIDATNHKVQQYLENIFQKFEKYLLDKTIVIFGVNMLFERDSCIEGFNLKEFASKKNCLYMPIKVNDFSIKNSVILNILNLILIKKIDNKKESLRKSSKEEKKLGGMKNNLARKINTLNSKNVNNSIYDITKMDIPSSLGYKKDYRINHINAFDTEKQSMFSKKKSRRYSYS